MRPSGLTSIFSFSPLCAQVLEKLQLGEEEVGDIEDFGSGARQGRQTTISNACFRHAHIQDMISLS